MYLARITLLLLVINISIPDVFCTVEVGGSASEGCIDYNVESGGWGHANKRERKRHLVDEMIVINNANADIIFQSSGGWSRDDGIFNIRNAVIRSGTTRTFSGIKWRYIRAAYDQNDFNPSNEHLGLSYDGTMDACYIAVGAPMASVTITIAEYAESTDGGNEVVEETRHPCDNVTCDDGSTCQFTDGGPQGSNAWCSCPDGFSGAFCEESTPESRRQISEFTRGVAFGMITGGLTLSTVASRLNIAERHMKINYRVNHVECMPQNLIMCE